MINAEFVYQANPAFIMFRQGLQADGIVSKRGCSSWYSTTITNILSNEKYAGNAVLGKTYKPDVLSKKRYKNDGNKSPISIIFSAHIIISFLGEYNKRMAFLGRSLVCRKRGSYMFQKPLCYRSKALVFVPDQVHLHLQMRIKRTEDQSALR